MDHNETQSEIKSILKHLNLLSLYERYTVAKTLTFKDYNLTQSNNGAYIMIKDLDSTIIHNMFCFIQQKIKIKNVLCKK